MEVEAVQVAEVVEEYEDIEGANKTAESLLLCDMGAAGNPSQFPCEAVAAEQDMHPVAPNSTSSGKKTRVVLRTVEPPPPSREVQIGRIARETLLYGKLLPDEYVVELVVEAARVIQAEYDLALASNVGTSDALRQSTSSSLSQVSVLMCMSV
jgi:hypothetical protein